MIGAPGEPPRVAYAIGKTVGGAVERNRVRRRLREIVRRQDLETGRGYMIRVVDPAALTTAPQTLETTLRSILSDLSHGEREK
jgi:ribonuclease P protein component